MSTIERVVCAQSVRKLGMLLSGPSAVLTGVDVWVPLVFRFGFIRF